MKTTLGQRIPNFIGDPVGSSMGRRGRGRGWSDYTAMPTRQAVANLQARPTTCPPGMTQVDAYGNCAVVTRQPGGGISAIA